MIESNIDSREWELEVERVAPRLKIPIQNDSKEWRNHIEQAKTYGQVIKKTLPDARSKLEKMSENLGKVLEKITKREKGINVNMNELVRPLINRIMALFEIGNRIQSKSWKLENKFNKIPWTWEVSKGEKGRNEKSQWKIWTSYGEFCWCELKTNYFKKSKISESSNQATDSSSLVKIKTAIQKLRQDIQAMDLRAGVLSHTVMQHKVREKRNPDEIGMAGKQK